MLKIPIVRIRGEKPIKKQNKAKLGFDKYKNFLIN